MMNLIELLLDLIFASNDSSSSSGEQNLVHGFTSDDEAATHHSSTSCEAAEFLQINPATGLPMISPGCGIDVGGNPYGSNLSDTDSLSSSFDSHSSFDSFGSDSFGSGFDSSFDSGFGSDFGSGSSGMGDW